MLRPLVALLATSLILLPHSEGYSSYIKDAPAPPKINSIVLRDQKELTCLARNVFFEARNQSKQGQVAVIMVTLNRIDPEKGMGSICKVVYRKCNFSWVCDGKKRLDPSRYNENTPDKDAWYKINSLVFSTLFAYDNDDSFEDITKGSTFYHNLNVEPEWVKLEHLVKVIQIDQHIFYRKYQI